jgi:tetratricopeptide (TPR) repeat protein
MSLPTETEQQTLSQATTLLQGGALAEAEALYRKALSTDPHSVALLNGLGQLLYRQGRTAEARPYFQQSLAQMANQIQVLRDLGNACFLLDCFEEAVEAYQQALVLDPNHAETCNNLGLAWMALGQTTQAIEQYLRAIEINPSIPEVYMHLAQAWVQTGQYGDAVAMYEGALALRQTDAEIYFQLGYVYQQVAVVEGGADPQAVARREAALVKAVQTYWQGLAYEPNDADAYYNLGNAFKQLDRLEEAKLCYEESLALRPDFAPAHNNLGYALRALQQLDTATQQYQQALCLDPTLQEAAFNLAVIHLLKGDFERGWPAYEHRQDRRRYTEGIPQPAWRGEGFSGKTLLVRAEQGYGDTFQFVRYLPQVKALGGQVVLECQPGLSSVLQGCAGIDLLVERVEGGGLPPVDFDLHVPLLSLPGLFGTTLETIPAPIPYITPDPTRVETWKERLCGEARLKIGIVWAGSAHNGDGRHRTCPLPFWQPLTCGTPWTWYSLQKGPEGDAWPHRPDSAPLTSALVDLAPQLHDFAETAALLAQLDLVITVDTAVAHLAGAMGRPVWVLLPFAGDWRWMVDRLDSPWYPGMRLFRQPAAGDWASVLQEVRQALETWASPSPKFS